MTLHQLAIFAAVAKHGNITKASEELHIAQPSVSRQLRLLEEYCNVKLYNKIDRGIELTKEGNLFLTDTEPILLQIQRLKDKFNPRSTDRKGEFLTIGGSHSQSVSFLPLLLAAFKEGHPQVEVTLRSDDSRAIEQCVLDSQVEIGLITNPSGISRLTYEPYRQEKIIFFVPAKHPLAKRKGLILEDIRGTSFVFKVARDGKIGNVERILKELIKDGLELNTGMRCESAGAIKTAVKAGIGVGILYEGDFRADGAGPDNADRHLKIIQISKLKMHVRTFLIYPKLNSLSPLAQEFLALLHRWPQKTRSREAFSGLSVDWTGMGQLG